MTTNEQKFGTAVFPGWVWVLPNSVYDEPNTMQIERDGIQIGFSVREYFTQPEANVGLLSNRQIKPLKGGTHSLSVFDSDISDIQLFEGMLNAQGMINGGRDFTIDIPNVYYSMPISKFIEFEAVSPLNVEPIVETQTEGEII